MTLIERIVAAGPHSVRLSFLAGSGASFEADACLHRLNLRYTFDSAKRLGEDAAIGLSEGSWHRVLRIQDYPYDVVVWGTDQAGPEEPQPMVLPQVKRFADPDELKAALTGGPRLHLETLLQDENPQLAYGFLLRVGALLAGDGAVACYDAGALRLRMMEEVHVMTQSQAPPSIEDIYSPVMVRSEASDTAEGKPMAQAHLTTRGLLRCLRPDMVLPAIDPLRLEEGRKLLRWMAGMMMLQGVPEPGQVFYPLGMMPLLTFVRLSDLPWLSKLAASPEVAELTVAVLPADELAKTLKKNDSNMLLEGDMARLTGHLLDLLSDLGVELLGPYEARIEEAQARERLGIFRALWECGEELKIDLLYKVGIDIPGAETADKAEVEPQGLVELAEGGEDSGRLGAGKEPRREYVWFRLRDVLEGSYQGELVTQPANLVGLELGDLVWHPPTLIAGWVVQLESGATLTPRDVLALKSLLRQSSAQPAE